MKVLEAQKLLYILGDIAGGLQIEAQTGTLEQLFLSRFGAIKVFLMRSLAKLTNHIVIILVVYWSSCCLLVVV